MIKLLTRLFSGNISVNIKDEKFQYTLNSSPFAGISTC